MRAGQKSTGPIPLLVSVGAIALFGFIGVLLVWMSGGPADTLEEKWSGYGITIDPNCRPGTLGGEAAKEDEVEYGSLHYLLNTAPFFPDCDTEGSICFQSNKGNRHFVRISYVLDDGDEVYRSDMLPPDSHIQKAKLQKRLADGVYPGVCRIALFDMDTLELLGTLEETITITVQR
ncbi:MAG: hypothetical protein HFK04_04100 [Oscillospiraceae bacterium]|nr:hypothetical protein [Oscillospiraceae bacterium]